MARSWRRRAEAATAEERRMAELFRLEDGLRERGYFVVAGVDEVGRGALAGPVVAAAVVLGEDARRGVGGLKDSKLLDSRSRERISEEIKACAVAWSVAHAEPADIDRMGIQQANMSAMGGALEALDVECDYVLADAFELKGLPMPCAGIVKGDKRSASIAAASVIAKVFRDGLMSELAVEHPGYGFERNAGYGCAEHMEALERLGPSPVHRLSFAPVAACRMDRLGLGRSHG